MKNNLRSKILAGMLVLVLALTNLSAVTAESRWNQLLCGLLGHHQWERHADQSME